MAAWEDEVVEIVEGGAVGGCGRGGDEEVGWLVTQGVCGESWRATGRAAAAGVEEEGVARRRGGEGPPRRARTSGDETRRGSLE